MIAEALYDEIRRYAVRMRTENPLFWKAEEGILTAQQVQRYLVSVHYMVGLSPEYLERARDRARALGDEALAMHFHDKGGEELGHDQWAERDIERVSSLAPSVDRRDVAPPMREQARWLFSIIDEDPVLFLSYMLFTESLVVLLGPEWLKYVEERCGIPRSSMTVIDNHVELDREHVDEALDMIDRLVGDPRKLPRMREVLARSIEYFDRFCEDVTSSGAAHDSGTTRSAEITASVA